MCSLRDRVTLGTRWELLQCCMLCLLFCVCLSIKDGATSRCRLAGGGANMATGVGVLWIFSRVLLVAAAWQRSFLSSRPALAGGCRPLKGGIHPDLFGFSWCVQAACDHQLLRCGIGSPGRTAARALSLPLFPESSLAVWLALRLAGVLGLLPSAARLCFFSCRSSAQTLSFGFGSWAGRVVWVSSRECLWAGVTGLMTHRHHNESARWGANEAHVCGVSLS